MPGKDNNSSNRLKRKKDVRKPRNMYFDNPKVESLLREYVKGGCTSVEMRDEIMSHALELIRQVIRTHGLYLTYGGGESSFADLEQVAWVQIEKTLYKFDYSKIFTVKYDDDKTGKKKTYKVRGCIRKEYPDHYIIKITKNSEAEVNGRLLEFYVDDLIILHKEDIRSSRFDNTKVFNMWSQVAKTSVLAYIKKETRDRKNYSNFLDHQKQKPLFSNTQLPRFFKEARDMCQYDDDELKIIEALEKLADSNIENLANGLISRLIEETELSRQQIVGFFKKIRSFENEFSDSPSNLEKNWIGNPGGPVRKYNIDNEDDY